MQRLYRMSSSVFHKIPVVTSRNGTTRYGRLRKNLPRFCDFLLTGFFPGSILRFQIRGTWKRQADQSRGDVSWSDIWPTYLPGITEKNEREVNAPRSSSSGGVPMFGLVHFTGTGRAWAFCGRFFSAGSFHFTESSDLAPGAVHPCVGQGSKIEGFPLCGPGARSGEERWQR
jgi:hypothetical protein